MADVKRTVRDHLISDDNGQFKTPSNTKSIVANEMQKRVSYTGRKIISRWRELGNGRSHRILLLVVDEEARGTGGSGRQEVNV